MSAGAGSDWPAGTALPQLVGQGRSPNLRGPLPSLEAARPLPKLDKQVGGRESGWRLGGERLPQAASRPQGRTTGRRKSQTSPSSANGRGGAGGEKATLGSDKRGRGPGQEAWLTWEVIMMLESIRKLMAMCGDSACLHCPRPETAAAGAAYPLHRWPSPGASAGTEAAQPDAIKLRPSQPISDGTDCFSVQGWAGRTRVA